MGKGFEQNRNCFKEYMQMAREAWVAQWVKNISKWPIGT